MIIDSHTSLLNPVYFLPSPHCDDRPPNTIIDMIVIHGISLPPNEFGTGAIEKFFCNQLDFTTHPYFSNLTELKVSAHILINRLGKVTQFVPFSKRAWHAGQSFFQNRIACNDFSIGIELEGTDTMPYEDIQYQQLAKLIKVIQGSYPHIISSHIVGHSDIAPGRKTDPGPFFDWAYLARILHEASS